MIKNHTGMSAIGKQRGVSFWGLVWGAALFISLTAIMVRSLPPYLNDQKINKALNLLIEERSVMTDTRITLLRKMKRRLNIDYADEYVDLDKAFQVKRVKDKRVMTVNYEVVVHLLYNANLLFIFENEVIAAREGSG